MQRSLRACPPPLGLWNKRDASTDRTSEQETLNKANGVITCKHDGAGLLTHTFSKRCAGASKSSRPQTTTARSKRCIRALGVEPIAIHKAKFFFMFHSNNYRPAGKHLLINRGTAGAPLACRAWAAPIAARAPRRRRPTRSRRCRSRRSCASCGRCSNLRRGLRRFGAFRSASFVSLRLFRFICFASFCKRFVSQRFVFVTRFSSFVVLSAACARARQVRFHHVLQSHCCCHGNER